MRSMRPGFQTSLAGMSFGNFQKFFASLRTTLSGLEKPTCENPNPFANQEVPIKVLPFHGILCIHRVDV